MAYDQPMLTHGPATSPRHPAAVPGFEVFKEVHGIRLASARAGAHVGKALDGLVMVKGGLPSGKLPWKL